MVPIQQQPESLLVITRYWLLLFELVFQLLFDLVFQLLFELVFHAVLVSVSFYSRLKAYTSPTGVQLSSSKGSLRAETKLVCTPETSDRHFYVHRRNGSYKAKCIPWAANFSDLRLLSSDLSCQNQQGNGRTGVHSLCEIDWSIPRHSSTFPSSEVTARTVKPPL